MVVHICEYTENHQGVHCKWVNYMALELNFNKVVKTQECVKSINTSESNFSYLFRSNNVDGGTIQIIFVNEHIFLN